MRMHERLAVFKRDVSGERHHFGFLIDHGHPELVLVLVAVILLASLLCMGSAKASARAVPMVVSAAE